VDWRRRFNHDGKPDIAFQICQSCTPSGRPLLIFLGNGDGTFQSPISYTWTGLTQSGTIADLNNDGIPDIIMLSYTEGSNVPIAAVFLGNGDGTFKPPQYVQAAHAAQPNQIMAADLNGDGKADLAVTDWWSNSLYLFAGSGDGTFGPQIEIGGPMAPGLISATDLQGQSQPGFPDIILQRRLAVAGTFTEYRAMPDRQVITRPPHIPPVVQSSADVGISCRISPVLRKVPRKVSPDTIKDIVVDATYMGGERVWQAGPNATAHIVMLPDTFYGDGDELENLNP
jgi:hypothetical protein